MKILVTGASGFIGKTLVPALKAGGHEVICPSRGGVLPVELEAPESFRPYMDGIDVVIHLAAHNPRPWQRDARDRDLFMRLNAVASGALAKQAVGAGAKAFVLASSARVYGIGTSPYSESSPLLANDAYGRSKIVAETVVASALFSTNCVPIMLRMAMLTGKKGGWISLAANLNKIGLSLPPQILAAKRSTLSSEVLSQALCEIVLRPNDFRGPLNMADDKVRTLAEIAGCSQSTNSSAEHAGSWLTSLAARAPLISESLKHAMHDCVLNVERLRSLA